MNWMLIIMENLFFSQIINVTLHHFSKSGHLTENNYEFLIDASLLRYYICCPDIMCWAPTTVCMDSSF